MLSPGYMEELLIFYAPSFAPSFVVKMLPCLNTVREESEISADAVPFLLAFELEVSPEFTFYYDV